MVNNLRWSELLPSVATDVSPFVKSLGKFQDSLGLYGVGTGIAGLEGLNRIIQETHAAYTVWMRPDQEHVKPSLPRFAFGVLNVAGYGIYGAGAGGVLGRYATGGGLLLVTASNVMKQHFLPEEETHRRRDPILPLHRSDVAADMRPAAGGVPDPGDVARYAALSPATPTAAPGPDDRWLMAGGLESGTLRRRVPSGAPGHAPTPPTGAPVTGALPPPAVRPGTGTPVGAPAVHRANGAGTEPRPAAGDAPPQAPAAASGVLPAPGAVNPVAAAAAACLPQRGRSHSLPNLNPAPQADTAAPRRGSTGSTVPAAAYPVTSSRANGARRRSR
ncbi:hypothetical protein [Streptomyces sp. NPDC059850]|uniref:hypothetical protein n=1 Tax=Streptomyces sp. NPDC059850 TaxID=3346970 RepID=UPI003664DC5D